MSPPHDPPLSRNELRQALRDLREDLKNDFKDGLRDLADRLEAHDGRIRANERDIVELKAASREAGRQAGKASGTKYATIVATGLYAIFELLKMIAGNLGGGGHK